MRPHVDISFIDPQQNNLSYLKRFDGKYPNEVKLLSDKLLAKRLRVLIKNKYQFLLKTWAVETPIEIKNNVLYAWGCQEHNCDNTNFIIAIDLKKNVVYVGIRQHDIVNTYSEDGSSNASVINWAGRK